MTFSPVTRFHNAYVSCSELSFLYESSIPLTLNAIPATKLAVADPQLCLEQNQIHTWCYNLNKYQMHCELFLCACLADRTKNMETDTSVFDHLKPYCLAAANVKFVFFLHRVATGFDCLLLGLLLL